MKYARQSAQSLNHNSDSPRPWLRLVLGSAAFICLGLASECLADAAISPAGLVFHAEAGATNPPSQALSVQNSNSRQTSLTASDNVSWLAVSPASTFFQGSAQLSVSVNTSGLTAGTYNATVTIKVGSWDTTVVPVTLMVSPATQSTTSTTTVKSVTLSWNAVTNTAVQGHNLYLGTAPGRYTQKITVGNVTSYTIGRLSVGTTYYFAVTAFNSAGESVPSNEVYWTIY